ncbi:MAG UNVERIFIED_CONTAM: hypothetical protein LVR18_14410 [Planctomycetaceae bacterium]|jgi:hypothetical protein
MRLTSTGGAITVDAQGTVNFGSLSFTSTGPISVTEDSSTDFLGSSTAGSLIITSSSTVSDSAGGAAQIYVSENVSLNGTHIILGDTAEDSLTVVGNLLVSATGGGDISVLDNGTMNFGTITFQTNGLVRFREDSDTEIIGDNSARNIILTSEGA